MQPTQLTEDQVKDIQARIEEAGKSIGEILKEKELAIAGKVTKVEIMPGVFADTVQVGYTDTKYAPKPSAEVKDNKVELATE